MSRQVDYNFLQGNEQSFAGAFTNGLATFAYNWFMIFAYNFAYNFMSHGIRVVTVTSK